MTGGQEDTTSGLAEANQMRSGGSRENTVLADEELLDAVRGTNLGSKLDNLGVPEAAITTNDESRTCKFMVRWHLFSDSCVMLLFVPSTPSGMESKMLVTKASL